MGAGMRLTAILCLGGLLLAGSAVAQQAQQHRYIPHIVSGGGFVTKITIQNQSKSPNDITVSYLSQNGLVVDTKSATLPADGMLRIQTAETDRFAPVTIRWAIVDSKDPVAINLFFELADSPQTNTVISTVGFNDAPAGQSFTLPMEIERTPPPGYTTRARWAWRWQMSRARATPSPSAWSIPPAPCW